MFNKKFFILTIFLIALLSISVVSAEDSADSVLVVDDSVVLEENVEDAAVLDESLENIETNDENSDSVTFADTEKLDLDSKEIEISESVDADSKDVADEVISDKGPKNILKSSSSDSPYHAYVDPLTTYYVSGRYIYFGWQGYFDGWFRIVNSKGSVVFNEYLSGYDDDRQYCIDSLNAGTYYAGLVDTDYGLLDYSKVVIKKATSKIYVKSFTTRAGVRFHCYAYVKDKNDGANINGGYVKFKIAGKTYKAKLKNGVASFYFKVPKKVKKYTCKAYYLGGKNVKKSSTKFKMKVKKGKKYKVLTVKTRWDKYVSKKWRKYKVETYKFRTPSMSTLCMFLYKNGKMIEGKHYLTKIKYKYRGKWYWTKWRTGHGEAYYQKTAGIDLGVKIGKVKFKFPVS